MLCAILYDSKHCAKPLIDPCLACLTLQWSLPRQEVLALRCAGVCQVFSTACNPHGSVEDGLTANLPTLVAEFMHQFACTGAGTGKQGFLDEARSLCSYYGAWIHLCRQATKHPSATCTKHPMT
jgi:hypothetical protein